MTSFQRPIGPKADLAELEYIASLHQTCFPELRNDCSISPSDVVLFLRSRYGLKIAQERALDIIRGLGGTVRGTHDEEAGRSIISHCDDEHSNMSTKSNRGSSCSTTFSPRHNNEGYLDIVQWVSTLLIPTLIKAKQDSVSERDRLHCEINRVQQSVAFRPEAFNLLDIFDTMWKQQQLRRELQSLRDEQSLLVDHCFIDIVRKALVASIQEEGQDLPASPPLTESFVKQLLIAYGEDSAADDAELVKQMATISSCQLDETVVFDKKTFSSLLTQDISLWECGLEDTLSTPFFDVYGFDPDGYSNAISGASESIHRDENILTSEEEQEEGNALAHVSDQQDSINWTTGLASILSTGPSIDSAVDTHQSIVFLMAVWAYFIFSVTVYMTFLNATNYDIFHCGEGFGCILINRIWTWFSLGMILSFGGIIIIIPISVSNDPYKVTWKRAIVSAIALIVFTIAPYIGMEGYKQGIPHGDNGQFTSLDITVTTKWFRVAIDVYIAYGLILLIFLPKHAMKHCVSPQTVLGKQFLSSDTVRSAGTKVAATRKINQLLQNAGKMHLDDETQRGPNKIMARYLLHQDSYQDAGGVFWSLSMLLSNRLLREHGVWIHSSLAVAQEGQVLAFVFLIMVLCYETDFVATRADDIIAEVKAADISSLRDLVLWYIPHGDVIRKSSYVGIAFSFGVGIALIITYLPSTTSTIFKLRCGVIPSMYDCHFRKYRYAADTTYYNLGNMIYGLVGAQILFYSFFGGLVFLCTWSVTRQGTIRFLAWFTALMITILLKYFLCRSFRKQFYTAFYRQRPKAANISALAMECWHIGLGGGVLVGRLVQFLLASAFWIGRIDVSFLCEDVHIFGYRFDTAPSNFRKELLVHEAHRHPYIDRLGTMYLMRLKHGQNFCSNAGCAWRRLFVQALMPWLLKYRLKTGIESVGSTLLPVTSESLETNTNDSVK